MNSQMTFEDLPNEVITEVFEYFTFDELCQTFSSLTRRLDALLCNDQHRQIILQKPKDCAHHLGRSLLPKRLTVSVAHSKKFFEPEESSLLENIHCLILEQPTREQWDSIQPGLFPNLTRLHLINSVFTYRTEELCRLIFSNAFPHLTTCTLSHVHYELNHQWTISLHLLSLHIYTWDVRVYSQVLLACPNLFRFTLELTRDNNEHIRSLFATTKTHLQLRQLILRPSSPITIELIDALLSFVPNLDYLSLKANHRQSSCIPVPTFVSVLEHRVPRLARVRIHLTLPDELCSSIRVHTTYPLFKDLELHSTLNGPSTLFVAARL